MTYVETILSQTAYVAKAQMKFMLAMFTAFFTFRGRATMTNLHRYGAPHPRTQYRWHRRFFDFSDFNRQLLEAHEVTSHRLIAALDCSFVAKSGKRTHGLAWFHNGCASRNERGLEISLLALVDLEANTAYAIDAQQTPAHLPPNQSRVDFYLDQVRRQAPFLPDSVNHLAADGFYAKVKFIDGVVDEIGLDVVSKLRKDADLKYLYDGPRKKGPGRPKVYDGKVYFDDLTRWDALGADENEVELYTKVVWHVSLKRKIRVVLLQRRSGRRVGYVLLFSTDLKLSGWDIYRYYKSRFQIEFVFRDAKQHTGLCDGQMRSEAGLDFHFNLSLAALNVLRLQQRAEGRKVISIASAKRRNYNESFMNEIFSRLELDPTDPKFAPHVEELRHYGALAA